MAQSNPLCRKIVVVSEPDLKRKPVASSTLSKANKICSPSTATIGRSDMIIFSPILPVNIPDLSQAITVRGVADRFAGKRHRTASPLSKSLNGIRKCDDDDQRNTRGAANGTYTAKPMLGTTASRIETRAASRQANHPYNFPRIAQFFRAARWLLNNTSSMTTTLFVILGAWMLLSLIFCLALCVAASKPVPESEAHEESFEISQQHAAHEHVLCLKGFSSPAASAKRSSDTRFLPSTLTNASESF